MAKADSYKVIVKNGDTEYVADKHGAYSTKTVDYVIEFDNFTAALAEFLEFIGDTYQEDKVSLVYKKAKN